MKHTTKLTWRWAGRTSTDVQSGGPPAALCYRRRTGVDAGQECAAIVGRSGAQSFGPERDFV